MNKEDEWHSISLNEHVEITLDKCCYNYLSIIYSPSGRYGITTYWNCLSHAPRGGYYSLRITDILLRETFLYTMHNDEVIMRKMFGYWISESEIVLYFPGLIEWQLFQYRCHVDHKNRRMVKLSSRLIDREVLFKDCHAPASTEPVVVNKNGSLLEYLAVKSDQEPEKATLLPYLVEEDSSKAFQYKPLFLNFTSFTQQDIFVHTNPLIYKNKAYFCLRDTNSGISFLHRFLCVDIGLLRFNQGNEISLNNNSVGLSFIHPLQCSAGTFETNRGAFYEYCQKGHLVSFVEAYSSEVAPQTSSRRIWTLNLQENTIDERSVDVPDRCIAVPNDHLTFLWKFHLQYTEVGKDCLELKTIPYKNGRIPKLADLARALILTSKRRCSPQCLEKFSHFIYPQPYQENKKIMNN